MKIWVQPGGKDRRVPMETSTARAPRWFQQDVPTLVPLTPYIADRLRDKDLVEVEAPKTPAPEAASPPAAPSQPKGGAATPPKAE